MITSELILPPNSHSFPYLWKVLPLSGGTSKVRRIFLFQMNKCIFVVFSLKKLRTENICQLLSGLFYEKFKIFFRVFCCGIP